MKKPVVVLLAGGIGKRFAPFTINKTLFPFLGKPFLQHLLEQLQSAGFEEVIMTTNSETEPWVKTYSGPLTIKTVVQPEARGMGDAMLKLEQEIGSQPVLVMNATDIIDPTFFGKILEASQNSYSFIVGKKMSEYFSGGYLKTEGNRVTEIVEKPAPGTQPSDMINLVYHYFSQPQDFYAQLHAVSSESDDVYEQALSHLMKEKEISYLPYDGFWKKLNYCYTVLDMTEIFLQKFVKKYTAPTATVSPNAVVDGDVYIDEGAKIEDFAVIKGPAYIGKNVIVGNHSLLRQSIIEEKTIVGFGSEVARSYVGPHCMLHHNFIGDSILESDINPSWGTTTANLRIDGKTIRVKLPDKTIDTTRTKLGALIAKGAFLGVNCSIMPGITLGENAKVLPATRLMKPVADNEEFTG